MRRGTRVRTLEKINTALAKAPGSAKKKFLVFFANFAYFAALREPGFSVAGLIHGFSHPRHTCARQRVVIAGRLMCDGRSLSW
jgi:hypothetical protein